MRILLIFTCLLTLLSCNNQNGTKGAEIPAKDSASVNIDVVADSSECETAEDTTYRETLNDIRFKGWTKKEWVDNEYISEVRRYIDAYNSGEISNSYLDEYKDFIKGKFVIADIQPYITGGAYISIIFYDNPDKIFSAVVYSYIDEKTKKVTKYEFRSMDLTLSGYDITQEEIQQFLKECPEHKLW